MTKNEAADKIEALALEAENENYHSLAGVLWRDVVPAIEAVDGPVTVIVVDELNGITTLEVS